MLNRDGRPISTRKGDGTELIDLINKAVEIGLEKYEASHADRKAQVRRATQSRGSRTAAPPQ